MANDCLPLYKQGLGWIIPALVGGVLGLILTWFGIGRRAQDGSACRP
jgi:Branched-chain amino acid permeases